MGNKTKSELRDIAIQTIYERAKLKELGFKKTKSAFKRKDGSFLDLITFGSSRQSNMDEDTNKLEVRAHTCNSDFKKFQNEQLGLTYLDGIIAGSLIENLEIDGPPYIRYDIGITQESLEKATARIVEVIETTCLPFFELCRDIEQVVENVHKQSFLPLQRTLEYFIFCDRNDLIDQMIDHTANHDPAFIDYLQEYILEIENNGIPEHEFFSNSSGNQYRVSAGNLAIRLHQLDIKTKYHKT